MYWACLGGSIGSAVVGSPGSLAGESVGGAESLREVEAAHMTASKTPVRSKADRIGAPCEPKLDRTKMERRQRMIVLELIRHRPFEPVLAVYETYAFTGLSLDLLAA